MLVLRAQLGDRDALDQLYCSISPNLLRFLEGIVQNVATAEDVMQEVLLRIYRKIRWLREPEHFRAWAYRLAAREAIRAANRGRHEAQLTDDEWNAIRHPQAEPLVERRILGEAAMREIAALPPASRAILGLHYMEGWRSGRLRPFSTYL
jgi:RNA polymerase sigma factor (sigma-70 family)